MANCRLGNFPQIGKLAAHEFTNEMTHLQLQFIEMLSLHLMVGIALEIAAPFALILPHHKFRSTHAAECIGKVRIRIGFCAFFQRTSANRNEYASVRARSPSSCERWEVRE